MNYFVSDLHLGHKKILEFEREKFKTIEEHDDFIMSILEKRVSKDDTLYNLGDFIFKYVSDKIIDRYRKLPCKKILIMGNHDSYTKLEEMKIFDEIYKNPIFLTRRILLSHEPEMVSPYVLNIHGHLHSSFLDSDNHLNVNIFIQNYNVVSEKMVMKKLGTLPEFSKAFGSEWYFDKYIFTKTENDKVLDVNGKIDVEKTIELWEKTFEEKELLDGSKIELKKIANANDRNLYKDAEDNYYIGTWTGNGVEEITPSNIEIIGDKNEYSESIERWDRYYVNGKKYSKMFPRAKKNEKYIYTREKIDEN